MVIIFLFPASVISFQLSCLVVNFLGHMLPSASSTEVDVGEGLDKNLNPIYRWLASSPSPDSLGYVTWRWLLNFSMPGLPHLFIETSLLRKLPAFLPSFTQHCSCCSGAQSCPTPVTPWTTARQASLSFTISQSLLKLMSIESAMPSNQLILCCPLLLLL